MMKILSPLSRSGFQDVLQSLIYIYIPATVLPVAVHSVSLCDPLDQGYRLTIFYILNA